MFGIILSGFNHLERGDYISFFFEFIPRALFLMCTFGYMVIIIIIKVMLFQNIFCKFHLSSGALSLPIHNTPLIWLLRWLPCFCHQVYFESVLLIYLMLVLRKAPLVPLENYTTAKVTYFKQVLLEF